MDHRCRSEENVGLSLLPLVPLPCSICFLLFAFVCAVGVVGVGVCVVFVVLSTDPFFLTSAAASCVCCVEACVARRVCVAVCGVWSCSRGEIDFLGVCGVSVAFLKVSNGLI
jgi:hypothetical protein